MLQQSNFTSQNATYRNNYFPDKPNEDIIIADDKKGIYILLDGVSVDRENGIYPNPSPALLASEIFSQSVYNTLASYDYKDTNLSSIIEASIKIANKELNIFNQKNKFPFKAGTVGIIAMTYNDTFYYSYIGDCFGRIISKNNVQIFTEEQTYLVRIHKKELTTKDIRFLICNNIKHPYGYGVFDGSLGALDFIRSGNIVISHNETIILSSDGYEPYLKNIQYPIPTNILTCAKNILDKNEKVDDRSIIIIKNKL